MLETLDQTNIGNLNLTEPKTLDYFFDTEKEITEKDWDLMQEYISSETHLTESWLAVTFIARLLATDQRIIKGINGKRWEEVERHLVLSTPRLVADRNFLFSLAQAKVVFSQLDLQDHISNIYNNNPESLMDLSDMTSDITGYLTYSSAMAILSGQPVKLNDEIREKAERDCKEYDIYSQAYYLSLARLSDPSFKPNLDQEDWLRMKGAFRTGMQTAENRLASLAGTLAASMKILAAEEVKLTPRGIELIMPDPKPDFRNFIPSLPEMRKF
ncbi:MAG: hypothetical protein Q7R49_01910 [Candidatus Daviesbacteria bacterium]|nr:hypothetical protein [Candidatus Daviesbacteria bacterium]